jgi:prepilin-type processing-associated H-X9-DG protein
MTARTATEIADALSAAAKERGRCPYLRHGETLVVVYADGSVERIENWPWLVEDCDEDIAVCFALRVSPFETRDLLGTLWLDQAAHRNAEPMGADDATMRAVRDSVRAGL